MTCLIRKIFNIPCPACGVTRALIALIKGDISGYKYYNIMALPLLIATILMILGTKFKKKSFEIISCIILLINIPYYFYRLRMGLIP